MAKISIIVPVYKVEEYLPRCIDSILVQTFTDFELILVDDGSADNSGSICDEYARLDSRIKVIHQENKYQSLALEAHNDIAPYLEYVGDYLSLDETHNRFKCGLIVQTTCHSKHSISIISVTNNSILDHLAFAFI